MAFMFTDQYGGSSKCAWVRLAQPLVADGGAGVRATITLHDRYIFNKCRTLLACPHAANRGGRASTSGRHLPTVVVFEPTRVVRVLAVQQDAAATHQGMRLGSCLLEPQDHFSSSQLKVFSPGLQVDWD